MPQIEDVVYKFLGLERPKPREKNGPCNLKDLLPKDLDPVSPESDRNSLKDESLESMDINDEHLNGPKENPSESKSRFDNEDIKQMEDTIKGDEVKKCENNIKVEDFENIEEIKKVEETNNQEEIKNGPVDLDENSMDEFEKPLTKTASTSNLNISFKSDDKTEEEEESPQFEPIDIMNLNESNLSNDSHLSGISELTSHRSRSPDYSNDFSRDNFDLSNHDQDSQLSKVSSNSRLSIITDFGSSNQASTQFPNSNEDSKDKYSKDNFRAIRDIEEGKYKESKFNFESVKNKSNSQEKDSKSFKSFSSKENSRDENDSCLKEKNETKDGKDKNESSKSKISKSERESRDSRRDRDRKKQGSSSSSRHSKSSINERDQSREGSEKKKLKEEKPKEKEEKKVKDEKKEKEDKKEKDEKKDPEKQEIVQDIFKDLKDIYKEKIRELREKKELTEKEKLNKDSKIKDSKERSDSSRDKKDYKKDSKTSKSLDRHEKSSRKSNESRDKERKRDDHHHSKDSKSRSSRSEKEPRAKKEGKSERSEKSESRKDTKNESQSKEKKQREEKKKSKDDHSSLRKNSNDRRSTDRDGSNGSSSKSSQKNSSSTGKSTTSLTKETNNTNNSSGDTSDGIEDSQGNDNKLAIAEFESQKTGINCTSEDFQNLKNDHSNSNTSNEAVLPIKKRPFSEDSPSLSPVELKLKKPKFAKNFHEAKKLMKIRRRMEKQNAKGLQSEVRKLKIEGTGSESLSNSPLPAKDITKVPDEERVQIIEVPDEECEEPYSEEMASMTLKETSMIILEGEVLGQSQQKESKLSLMERSIRQSLDEMMSDQKLAENAERNIENEAPANSKANALQIANISSEKDIKNVKEASILLENEQKDENFNAEKSLDVKMEESLEKLDKDDWKFKNIRGEKETDKFKNQQNKGIKVASEEKDDSQNESGYITLSPNMELKECSQKISKEPNISEDKETIFEENLKVVKEFLPKNNKQVGDKEEEDQLKDCSALSEVEEDCLYLEPDNKRAWRFATFLKAFEKELNLNQKVESFGENSQERSEPKTMAPPQLKRKLSSSPLSDILLQNTNNNNDGIKEGKTEAHDEGDHGEKRRKLGRPKKQRPNLSSFNQPVLLNGENFVMPLSPESDVSASSEKTSGQANKEEKR